MSNPPSVGQEPWGAELNAYLASLDARLGVVEAKPTYIFNSYAWQYSNAAPPPPTTGNSQVRFNNANLTLATTAVFRLTDSDGADRKSLFQTLTTGSQFRINDWDNSTVFHRFNVTGTTTLTATDATIPVTWVSGTGTIPNAKANVAFLVVLL